MKKLVSILIAGSMAAAICPCTGFAAEGESTVATTTGSFTYTENFDSMANGSLPAGWTLYRNSTNWGKQIKAQVKNGALEISENNSSGKGGYLIFDTAGFANVNSQDLTMECDITLGNSLGVPLNEPTVDDCVGFAYAFDTSKITGAIDNSTGVNVVTNGVNYEAAFRVRMYTNKGADTTNQILLSEKYNNRTDGDIYRAHTITSTENKINTDGTNRKMKLKIAVTDTNKCPTIYLDGTQVTCPAPYGDYVTPQRTSGKIGLYIKNTAVTIDNIKITGTGTYPTATTYKASFKTAGAKYETIDAAKADVLVGEYDCFGNLKTDVTSSATITPTDNGNGTGTISVSYNGTDITTLSCKILSKNTRSFVYEENFDTMADGSLPEGWRLYSRVGTEKTQAVVKNGALSFKSNSNMGFEWLLFDNLSDVDVDNLTMECDITYQTNEATSDQTQGVAGLAYAVEVTDPTAATYDGNNLHGSFAALYTDKTDKTNQQAVLRWYKKAKSDGTGAGTTDNGYDAADVTAMNQNGGQSIHLKIVFDKASGTQYYPPTVTVGNTVINPSRGGQNSDRYLTKGKIGLYLKHSNVLIDNIKVTGTRSDFTPDADSLAVSSIKYDSANSKLNVMADASLTAAKSANSAIIAAVFDNSDRLVSASTVSVDASKVVDYHGTIAIDGVTTAPAAGRVKLFFWDMDNINPFIQNDVK